MPSLQCPGPSYCRGLNEYRYTDNLLGENPLKKGITQPTFLNFLLHRAIILEQIVKTL